MRHSRLEVNKNMFSQRIVQDWNSLSEGTVGVTTLNIFKTRLDKQWQAMRYVALYRHKEQNTRQAQLYIPCFGMQLIFYLE